MHSDSTYNEELDLQLLAEEDEAAYRRLYDRYAGKIFSIAYSYLKSHTAAQDIVQDIFLKIWTKRKELSGLNNFEGWVRMVTRNLLIDTLRKLAREKKLLQRQLTQKDEDPLQPVVDNETAAIIRRGIDQLSPRQREVYLLAREQGFSYNDIANQLSLSPETVKEHMKQALRHLKMYIREYLAILTYLLTRL